MDFACHWMPPNNEAPRRWLDQDATFDVDSLGGLIRVSLGYVRENESQPDRGWDDALNGVHFHHVHEPPSNARDLLSYEGPDVWWHGLYFECESHVNEPVAHRDNRIERSFAITMGAPHWVVAPALLLPSVLWVARKYRRKRESGKCRKCGYDLRATPDKCPECGAVPAAK
jgi:hypothetical protein